VIVAKDAIDSHQVGRRYPIDAATFADLAEQQRTMLLRLAARLARTDRPEDVVQDALLRAWRYRSTFDESRGSFANWLIGIVANEARSKSRRRRWLGLTGDRASAIQSHSEDRVDLERAIRTLSARQRLAIDCYYFAGLTVEQTAAVMRCSEGTVKSTLSDARGRLKNLLEVRS
jgi:RNA polymerase sigma-70 factor (ECF subfamily)